MSKSRVLVADDHSDVRQALSQLLRDCDYDVATAASPAETLSSVRQSPPDLLLLDLNYQRDTTSGAEGLELLRQIRALHAELPILVLTGWATVSLAVQAMQLGARDFLEKPWENDHVRSLVAHHLAGARMRSDKLRREAEETLPDTDDDGPVFRSRAMREVLALAGRIAASNVPVLLTGESGTGKNMLARWIHRHSTRAREAFVSVNLGGLAETLFESEIFGHVRGAFTDARSDRAGRIERASGGTLFLDEISSIPPAQQARLLHVFEDGTFERVGETHPRAANARFIAATNADLPKLIREGRFREDLYFRLNTVEIVLPPLRARREDIQLLAAYFLEKYAKESGRTPLTLSDDARRSLDAHQWPGNVRELAHVMQRTVLLAKNDSIEAADLRLSEVEAIDDLDKLTLVQAERYVIQRALESCGGDVAAAAAKLAISRSALYRWLEKLRQ